MLAILGIAAFIAFLVFAIVWGNKERDRQMGLWNAFSVETGLAITGAYPMTAFHGAAHGVTVALSHTVWRGRKGRRHYNHVVSVQLPAMTGDLTVSNEGFFDMIGKAFGGGPQMVEISRDGRRVYFTNSLYGAIDEQFYPEGLRGWMVKLDAAPAGGIAFDERFFVDWPAPHRPHQIRLEGGDCSSDSYCYP